MGNRKYFGTDGIRGTANTEPMTADVALKLGMAAGHHFTRGDHRHTVVIGKDTRLSGYMIEPALVSGFVSVGMDVILVGPMPTPAIAMLTKSLRADLGVMISASHNPYEDNGIKLFGPDGYKLDDATEAAIEHRMDNGLSAYRADASMLGRATRMEDATGRYIEYAKSTFPRGMRLDGLKVVVDCANGAAYKVAPRVLWELGAEVVKVGVDPDGKNINKGCGSLHTDLMRTQVVAHNADIGIALDGDADRLIVSDEKGHLVDGDQLLATVAATWQGHGLLRGDGVVATLMSNMGLERFLETQGLHLIRTNVGDRYVVEHMRAEGYNLGGEQSGHIVLGEHGTTGDGLVAALQVLSGLVETGEKASAVLRRFEPLPQVLKNVRLADRAQCEAVLAGDPVTAAVKAAESRLADGGRLLIRRSGTEPKLRVMAEGDDAVLIEQVVDDIVAAIRRQAQAAA